MLHCHYHCHFTLKIVEIVVVQVEIVVIILIIVEDVIVRRECGRRSRDCDGDCDCESHPKLFLHEMTAHRACNSYFTPDN